jgi:hypothetical protein
MAISVRKMAEQLGVGKSQVSRDAQAGMPMDSVEAARAWRLANHDVSRTAEGRIDRPAQTPAQIPPAAEAGLAPRAGAEAISAPASSGEAAAQPDEQDEDTRAYRQDRARNERLKAERAEIELAQMRGSVVDARDVEQLQFTAGRIVRDRIEMVPARAAADLHALVLAQIPEEHREAVAAGLELHAFERRLAEVLRQALAEAAQAIEDAQRDDEDDAA